jgi:hydrogenase nickel incorporation protein HypA/HybF
MHELSIALSLVELACEEAVRQPGRVCALHLKVGALAGIVPEALLASYEMACMDTPLAGSRLVIEQVPVVVFCLRCQAEQPVDGVQSLCCPTCGAPTPRVEHGRELELVAMEIEQ